MGTNTTYFLYSANVKLNCLVMMRLKIIGACNHFNTLNTLKKKKIYPKLTRRIYTKSQSKYYARPLNPEKKPISSENICYNIAKCSEFSNFIFTRVNIKCIAQDNVIRD